MNVVTASLGVQLLIEPTLLVAFCLQDGVFQCHRLYCMPAHEIITLQPIYCSPNWIWDTNKAQPSILYELQQLSSMTTLTPQVPINFVMDMCVMTFTQIICQQGNKSLLSKKQTTEKAPAGSQWDLNLEYCRSIGCSYLIYSGTSLTNLR